MSRLDDYRWLVSDAGASAFDIAEEMLCDHDLVAATSRLRKQFTATQTRLLLEQATLRKRAATKFAHAQKMFFTDIGLQQSSGEAVARYKARRFPANKRVSDLCCGIGGDLFSLALRGPAIGIERDPIVALLAEANCKAMGLSQAIIRTADVTTVSPTEMSLIHVDPDRRPQGRRTTSVSLHEPGEECLRALIGPSRGGAIKLAPATDASARWLADCELEWISHAGECKQIIAWFGELAVRPGRRTATALTPAGDAHSMTSDVVHDSNVEVARSIGKFVYEPDPALIASKLVAALADVHCLKVLSPQIAYFTGDVAVASGLLSAFEVIDHAPMDRKQVKAMLRRHGVGRLEIKKRGVDIDPARWQRELRSYGENSATLIISPHAGRIVAILSRRSAPARAVVEK